MKSSWISCDGHGETGPAPERWNAGYNRPMVYDRENYDYAQSQTYAPDRSFGPVRWDTMGGRDRTYMNPGRRR